MTALKGAICRASLLLFLCAPAHAMNDTDALVDRGLFPLVADSVRGSLVLKAESLTVLLTHTGVVERRSYFVSNRGAAMNVDLGSILGLNVATPDTTLEAVRVYLDGQEMPVRLQLGLLINRDRRVEVTSPESQVIQNCLDNNDGGVCSQDWVAFPVAFKAGQDRRIALEYTTRCGPRAAIELAIARLHFYTEQFWAEPTVPSVVVRLDVGEFGVPAREFAPSGQYRRHSKSPTEVAAKALTWRFRDYRRTDYYGHGLLHPFAINQEGILDRHLRGVGATSEDTTTARILRADTLVLTPSRSGRKRPAEAASITFELHRPARIELGVWDTNGKVVRRLFSIGQSSGSHTVTWDGLDYLSHPVAPGRYRFRLEVDGYWVGDREVGVVH